MSLQVVVDHQKCSGHARCAAMAPQVYELDAEGFSALTERSVPDDLETEARRGANACPERAITLS